MRASSAASSFSYLARRCFGRAAQNNLFFAITLAGIGGDVFQGRRRRRGRSSSAEEASSSSSSSSSLASMAAALLLAAPRADLVSSPSSLPSSPSAEVKL